MRKALGTLAAACLIGSSAAAHADAGEGIFRSALSYTVQVRTAVETPLEGDLKGTTRGAGFVIDAARGWVMTNAHVVSRSPSRVEVAFNGRPFAEASKVYVDPHLDLAIVQIASPVPEGLHAASLQCDAIPAVGHPVGAYGHPWNLRFTGTRGIVSGITTRSQRELLQTDAPINSGNSGGPLISLETGRVVGINTAQIVGSQNTNFAVPVTYACRVLELLRAGVDPSPPELSVVYYNDYDDERVLKVARNYRGSDAGLPLRPGDVIRGVVGVSDRIENETQLFHALRGRLDAFTLRVERDGAEMLLAGHAEPQRQVLDIEGVVAGGVLFAATPLRDAAEVHVGALMVHYVERGSDGDAKELRRGDFLEAVNGQTVANLAELETRLTESGRPATLTLKRYSGGDRAFVYLERTLRVDRVSRVAGNARRLEVAATHGHSAQ